MQDSIDQANELAQREVDAILAKRKTNTVGESSLYCHDCPEPIPQARRDAVKGCSYCIDCQQIEDLRNR